MMAPTRAGCCMRLLYRPSVPQLLDVNRSLILRDSGRVTAPEAVVGSRLDLRRLLGKTRTGPRLVRNALATAGGELSVKWEQVLMLGTPAVITVADEWRNGAVCLEKFALGLRKDAAEYAEVIHDIRAAQLRFYSAVRADLGITSGEIPAGVVIRATTGIAGLDTEPPPDRQNSDP